MSFEPIHDYACADTIVPDITLEMKIDSTAVLVLIGAELDVGIGGIQRECSDLYQYVSTIRKKSIRTIKHSKIQH